MINFDDIRKDLSNLDVCVIGDVMLDKYTIGKVSSISPEAPVPIVKVHRRFYKLGGASNVALNLKKLGVNVHLIGLVGNDEDASIIENLCKSNNIETLFFKQKANTTIKTRIMAGNQHIVRIDSEDYTPMTIENLESSIKYIKLHNLRNILISDYEEGCITHDTINYINLYHECYIGVDPKSKDYTKYLNCNIMFPNFNEFAQLCNLIPLDDKKTLLNDKKEKLKFTSVVRNLADKVRCEEIVVKQSEYGATYFNMDNDKIVHRDAIGTDIVDVTGAGDTFVSSFFAFSRCIPSIETVMDLAIAASYVKVTKLGVYSPSLDEIERVYNQTRRDNEISIDK